MAVQIPVLIEPLKEGAGFRATGMEPLDLSGEGPTEEEAVRCLQMAIEERLHAGAKVIAIDLPGHEEQGENPLLALAGDLADDPLFDAWQEAMQEYRRQRDREDAAG